MASPGQQQFRSDNPPSAFAGSSHNVNQFHDPHNHFSPHPPAPFAMDQDMSNMESFAASVQGATEGSSLGDSVNVDVGNVGTSHGASVHTGASSGQMVGMSTTPRMMASGQGSGQHSSQPHTPYSPTGAGPRASIDDGNGSVDPGLGMVGLSGGDQKRKRSKVSRACDECRRKKVRCDAAAEDGTIKTCTNCQKNGTPCGYNRIPMKRGPSKGYIKELSERVQQVESQMALTNTPGGYRQSMDGSTSGMYAEQLYSPEDTLSFKRNFSFSDQQAQRSPFANPEFNRDRMPSVGGWNPSASPHASGPGFRSGRDRGSIAIAPDQQAPPSAVRPFWAADSDINPRPVKRLKMSGLENDDRVRPLVVGHETLSKYYHSFHGSLPVLPDADTTVKVIEKTTPQIQHAFVAAVKLLPHPKLKLRNGESNGDSVGVTDPTIFKTREDLEDFVWDAARDAPETRSKEDNLVLLWTYIIIAVGVENDLSKLRGGNLSKGVILKQAVDLGWTCAQIEDQVDKEPSGFLATDPYTMHLARAWHCLGLLARFHSLAIGSSHMMPVGGKPALPNPRAAFALTEGFSIMCNVTLANVINLVKTEYPAIPFSLGIDGNVRMHIMAHLEDVRALVPVEPENETLYTQLQLFYDLATSRAALYRSQTEILLPAINLADTLKRYTTASEEKHVYDPLRMHFFVLTAITLLEFRQEGIDATSSKLAGDGIESLKTALEQISERDHIEDQNQQHDQQHTVEQHADEAGEEENGLTSRVEQSTNAIHWADALLKMIAERTKVADEIGVSGIEEGSGRNDGKNEPAVIVNFGLLMKHGYMNVLAASAGV